MSDIRLQRLADLLVSYSTEIQPGQWVGVLGDVVALPALREVYAAVLRAGGNPTLFLGDEAMTRAFLREASDEQIAWLDPSQTVYYEQADAYIRVGSSQNTRAMTNIPAARLQKWGAARRPWLETRLARAAEGKMKWVGTWYPNEASAQEASMSLEEYEDFIYGATFCDRPDPIGEWRRISAMQQAKVAWLAGKRQVVCKGPNIDLTLSIAGRAFINADGHYNMPDGEIFTGPVEDSMEGHVTFSYPTIYHGREVTGVQLEFKKGRVVKASADKNEEFLLKTIDTDEGARGVGEFAIGTNEGIQRFTRQILFDEKIGGSFHMALGKGYPESGSVAQSAIHWDMICDLRDGGQIWVDDQLLYENGKFVIEG